MAERSESSRISRFECGVKYISPLQRPEEKLSSQEEGQTFEVISLAEPILLLFSGKEEHNPFEC